jgi:radical SAM-linked protein
MALLSHLDLMRMLERALRRSALPISFTGGFHPLPRVQIALALPLGAEAQSEWMDLEFTEVQDPNHFCSTLQPLLPDGIQLLAAAEVPVRGKSLSQELTGAVWCFDLVQDEQTQIPVDWSAAVDQLLQAKTLVWHDTDKKGRPRERDCRPALKALQVTNQNSSGAARLRLEAAVDDMGRSLRPAQIQHWLAETVGQPLQVQRLTREALILSAQC